MSSSGKRQEHAASSSECPGAPRKPRSSRPPARDRSLSKRRIPTDASSDEEETGRSSQFMLAVQETAAAARREIQQWRVEPLDDDIPVLSLISPDPSPPPSPCPPTTEDPAPGLRRKRNEEATEDSKRACARVSNAAQETPHPRDPRRQPTTTSTTTPGPRATYAAVTTASTRHAPPPAAKTTTAKTAASTKTVTARKEASRPPPTLPLQGGKGTGHIRRRSTEEASTSWTGVTPTLANPTPDAQPAPKPTKEPRYPPIIIESFPNCTTHLRALKERLGRPPTVRPYNQGVRFTPTDGEEYRVIQAYLSNLGEADKVTWFSYAPTKDRNLKLAIRGLPYNTNPEEVKNELIALGYEPEIVKKIQARRGRPGCIFFASFKKTDNLTPGIYEVNELLCMPGVRLEHWRGRSGPAQCHRCQAFRHSSHNCYRRQACVRCGGEHFARDCPRPLDEPATCANCGGAHTANNPRCAVFREEARNKRAGTTATTTTAARVQRATAGPTPTAIKPEPSATLMAAANGPTARGTDQGENKQKKRKKKKKRKSVRKGATPPTAPTPEKDLSSAKALPAQAARQGRSYIPVSTPREVETAMTKTRTAAELEMLETALSILQEVLLAIREGADPTPLLLAGVAKLLACR